MEVYLVGGAVRDAQLGLPVKERDWVVVGETPKTMSDAGFKQVGKDFPVFLHPKTGEEYALARTERKAGRGYTGFTCDASPNVTLEEDLMRRDLTINAIAQAEDGTLIDPYGGLSDLKKRVLRHVSAAFIEDPLRVLRVARMAAKLAAFDFKVAAKTSDLLKQMTREGELTDLTPERVFAEVDKTLATKAPARFFEVLRDVGALAVLFPEIDNLFGVPNPVKSHPEVDSGVHAMLVLQAACELSTENAVRFAALCHDFGKGLTPKEKWPRHPGHEKAGVKLIDDFCTRLRVPKQYQRLAHIVGLYHGDCHRLLDASADTIYQLLLRLDAFRASSVVEEFILACTADHRGRTGYEGSPYPQGELLMLACDAAKRVESKSFVEQGLKGEALGEAIARARIEAIEKILA